jgi:lipopolysaccharide/colanic/teichoic acid biosynthesis glycosyltransferase
MYQRERLQRAVLPRAAAIQWIESAPSVQGNPCRFKRLFDLALAVPALIVCSPLILLLCVLISMECPRVSPVYRQRRIGLNGQQFWILKLRTMWPGSDDAPFEQQDISSRVTPLGSTLRRLKIDELPQIWNIIAGDMSIVGPRPLSVDECKDIEERHGFDLSYPGFYPRVRPGLIGLEQVNRKRKLTYAERFAYNAEYENAANIGLDAQIFAEAFKQCQQVCWLAIFAAVVEVLLLSAA